MSERYLCILIGSGSADWYEDSPSAEPDVENSPQR